ncbi:hypothetical protein [Streptomyces sp. MMG1121]|uniref:hypothetical protein n=1 Tax=Streptomyces sp. MMG1121 TaxID=1415544 RepID=UPI0006AF9428|nr:hypothetical protein [Streptomyces sp. MMG1121]KOV61944.1 hypothetical protein ADK64_26315 [Streptomyces sp. MMG1121]
MLRLTVRGASVAGARDTAPERAPGLLTRAGDVVAAYHPGVVRLARRIVELGRDRGEVRFTGPPKRLRTARGSATVERR